MLPVTKGRARIAVFAHDADLLGGVEADVAKVLSARVLVPAVTMERGAWGSVEATPMGYLVVEGLGVRATRLAGRSTAELVGPGDLVEPWLEEPDPTLRIDVSWHVEARMTLAVLDADFARVAVHHPSVVTALLQRLMLRIRRLSAQHALATVTPIEQRVMLALWQLADRWGRVTPRGVELPFALSHRLIAEFVCATRPTVSSVIGKLRSAGLLEQLDGRWVLREVLPEPSADGGPPGVDATAVEAERLALRRWAAEARRNGALLREEHVRLREALAATRGHYRADHQLPK